ncbi:hypothetical protein ACOSP7_006116 [Xanthoceras sorbifolium]
MVPSMWRDPPSKLGDNNFLLWKQQVTAALKGLGLLGFVNGTVTCPSTTIQGAGNEQVINPFYEYWQRQESLIVSWLLSSISDNYLTDLVGSDTSTEIWSTLLRLFLSQTRARVSQYKQEIQKLKKNNLTMREYLSKMKSLSDALASVGHKLSDDNQITNITNGLGSEYEYVVVTITSRVEPYTVSEACTLLLAHEKRIEAYTPNPDGSSPSANLAFHNLQKKQNVSPYQNTRSHQHQNYQNSYGNRGRGRGRNNGGRWSNNKIWCQLCGKVGHTVQKCFHRFDPSFTGIPNDGSSSSNSGGQGGLGGYPYANVAFQDNLNDNNVWFPDSGASSHVTNALSNLNVGAEYHGNSKLQVGNGAGFGQGSSSREV